MTQDIDQLVVWINDLDAKALARRGAAERALLDHAEAARPLLRRSLELVERPLLAAQAALLLQRLHDHGALLSLIEAAAKHAHPDVRAILLRAALELAEGEGGSEAMQQALGRLAADGGADVVELARRLAARLFPDPVSSAPAPPLPAGDALDTAAAGEARATGDEQPTPTLEVDDGDLASFATLAAHAEDAPLYAALARLGSHIRGERLAAEETLLAAGHRGRRLLIEALADPRLRVRAAAARLLTQAPNPDASGALLALATSPATGEDEQELRALALRALAASLVGVEAHIVDDLVAVSRDPDRFVRAGVAAALGRLPYQESAAALAEMLGDHDDFVVEEAARSLGRVGAPPDTIETVLRTLDGTVARAHAGLLRALTGLLAAPSYEDEALRERLLRQARAQLATGVAERVTAALALLDRLFTPPRRLGTGDVKTLATLAQGDDLDVVRAALGLLASHVGAGMSFVRDQLADVSHRDDASVATLIEAVEERLRSAESSPA